jgi:hypothetical protein
LCRAASLLGWARAARDLLTDPQIGLKERFPPASVAPGFGHQGSDTGYDAHPDTFGTCLVDISVAQPYGRTPLKPNKSKYRKCLRDSTKPVGVIF